MLIFSKAVVAALAKNGKSSGEDHKPVVKIFNPCGGATWLLTESDPDEPDRLFGLCDLGMGSPELGYVLRSELETVTGRLGLHMERDRWFKATKPLSEYTKEASALGRINA